VSRDELEAIIWQAFREHKNCHVKGRCEFCSALVDGVLIAADAYAAGDGEALAEARRAVLHRESRP
jgi:hypothetical protein